MSDCLACAPDIACVHRGAPAGGVKSCPWFKPKPAPGTVPNGSVMLLRITGEEDCDWIQLRLVCTFTEENGVMYENWSSPDCPMPQAMISEILTFLETHVCAPVSPDKAITKATLPASLLVRLMGPAWMSRFSQLVSEAAGGAGSAKLLPADVPTSAIKEAEVVLGITGPQP